jgi:hypothetical protein
VSVREKGRILGWSAHPPCRDPRSLAQIYLAGFAAEQLLTGRRSRELEIEVGLGVLAHLDRDLIETMAGVTSADGYGAVHQVLRTGVREIEAEVRGEVERLYAAARESLSAIWPAVADVAAALLEHEEIDRRGFDAVIGARDIVGPVLEVQRRRGR